MRESVLYGSLDVMEESGVEAEATKEGMGGNYDDIAKEQEALLSSNSIEIAVSRSISLVILVTILICVATLRRSSMLALFYGVADSPNISDTLPQSDPLISLPTASPSLPKTSSALSMSLPTAISILSVSNEYGVWNSSAMLPYPFLADALLVEPYKETTITLPDPIEGNHLSNLRYHVSYSLFYRYITI